MKTNVIAIDGYSSTGKSTVAKRLSKALQYVYVDSGAMYRAVSLYALENNCTKEGVINQQNLIQQLKDINIDFQYDEDAQQSFIYLNGINVENYIRNMRVSNIVSEVAVIPEVRNKLVELQRKIAQNHHIVMDGRDIGSVVLPHADVKFFMTADVKERANRRFRELISRGDNITFEQVLENLMQRDHIDTTRKHSPLIQSKDAIPIDNTTLDQKQQFDKMLEIINKNVQINS